MKTLKRRVIGSILAVLILMSVSVSAASAGWMHCRSDPIVILSNGLVLDLSADISVLPWRVEHVDYVLHVPQGVSLVLSVATPTWLTTVETFTVIDDAPPGQYHTETVVHTIPGNSSVTAHTILVSALGLQLDSVSVSGVEGQTLHAYVHTP